MKKIYFSLLFIACAVFNTCEAQHYVTIPDTAFVSWLHGHGYAGCMSGNQLDTTCNAVLTATTMKCYSVPIRDLTGIQYFKNLDTLDCYNDSLYSIPAFPPVLVSLNCSQNNLSSLPVLPSTLQSIKAPYNRLVSVPTLPSSLVLLSVDYNPALTSLPALPQGLHILGCGSDQLSSIPTLPLTLISLYCNNNQLSSLPALPVSLFLLQCSSNPIHNLPALPHALHTLQCSGNELDSLPALPVSLAYLECNYNNFTMLPALPSSLLLLSCNHNQITSLPALPGTVTIFDCSFNQLTALPALPDILTFLTCNNNPNLSCLPELKKVTHLDFSATAVTCLPDYGQVTNSTPLLNTIPLCGIFNPTGCTRFWNISGECYYDQNSDCAFDNIDVETNYVKTQLYSGGNLQQQVYTGGEGFYSFNAAYGNYTIQVDTNELPFIVSCPGSSSYTVAISAADSLSYSNDFAFKCRTEGFDIGVQSILNNGAIPRPTTIINLKTIAGDMSQLYGAHCATGISGQVQITYTGQITYVDPANAALTPSSVNGDTITWNIADFGTVNDFNAFNLLFRIDSNATPGTQACFTVTITPTGGDYNPLNNTGSYCFTIVNALDPNEKEVYPSGNTDTANHWLTYTIHFQNTGSAPALNIRVTDTLNNHLDPSTFQLLAYSAKNVTQIFGNDVVFNFPNINLPDSATSDSASRGYVQYKIKLKDNLPVGTQIQNTAYIYFDLNPAVVTNTTLNTISATTGIQKVSDELTFQLYPNPAKDFVIIETDAKAIGSAIHITDVTGREISKQQITNSRFRIATNNLSAGIYFVSLSNNGRMATRKLVVE